MAEYAIITGASQGLGKALSIELAKRKFNLILVSLENQAINSLSKEIKEKYQVDVQYFETDLSILDNVITFTDWVNGNYSISVLINNVGVGGSNKFTEVDAAYINHILQLNVVATSIITHQLLPNLQKNKRAYILNVSSMASLNPVGFKTVYPASKSYIDALSRCLYQELKGTNVSVSLVNPGPMKTNPEITKRIEMQGFWGKFISLDTEKVAKVCIDNLFKKIHLIRFNLLSLAIVKILPDWFILPLMTRTIKRELENQK
jgi:uncharacterized protein